MCLDLQQQSKMNGCWEKSQFNYFCSLSPKIIKVERCFHLLTRADAKGAKIITTKLIFMTSCQFSNKIDKIFSCNEFPYLYAGSVSHYPVLKHNIHCLAFRNAVHLFAVFPNINSISYLMNIR